jgi:hypothetical protein
MARFDKKARSMPSQVPSVGSLPGPPTRSGRDLRATHEYVEYNGNCVAASHDCGAYTPDSMLVAAPVADAVGAGVAAGEVGGDAAGGVGDDAADNSPSLLASGVEFGGVT